MQKLLLCKKIASCVGNPLDWARKISHNKNMTLSEKKLALFVQNAIDTYGSEAASNKIRREANMYRQNEQLLIDEGLNPAEVDAYLMAAAERLDTMLKDRRRR